MTTLGSIDQGGYNRLKPLVKTGDGFDRPTLKVKPGYLQMTLFPRLGVAGISTPWPFRYSQPVKMSISIAYRRGRNQHSFAFQIPSASKDVYKYSFFRQTIRDWNDLPESLISSSELSDDSVSKFPSLVRARA